MWEESLFEQQENTAKLATQGLAALGYDVSSLTTQIRARRVAHEVGVPTEADLKWKCTTVAPTMEQHFKNGSPELLAPQTMWPGFAYSLTLGQRRWFGMFTGMSVGRTITVQWIEKWPGTQSPRSFKVTANMHVPNDRKAQTQTEWVVRDVNAFFEQSAVWDTPVAKVSDKESKEKADPTEVKVPKSKKSLEDMMKEFGL